MNSSFLLPAIAIAAGGLAYFLVTLALTALSRRNATAVERYTFAIDDAARAEKPHGWPAFKAAATQRLKYAGWHGSLGPIALATGFLYAVVVVMFTVFGLPSILALVIGLPACLLLVMTIINRVQARQRRLFQGQLMQALSALAAQIEAGNGPQQALKQILPSLDDPLATGFEAALNAVVATQDLGKALEPLVAEYPSRAMTLFMAALDVDRISGGSLAPTLRQASDMLAKQFELAEETNAEISQAKSEFYVIIAIVSVMAFSLIVGGDPQARSAYTSPAGLVVLGIGVANFAIGLWRGMRIFTKVGGARL